MGQIPGQTQADTCCQDWLTHRLQTCLKPHSFRSSSVSSTYCLRPSGTMLCGPRYMSNSARQKFSLGKPMLTLASAKSVNPGGNRPPVSVPSSAQSVASEVSLQAICQHGASSMNSAPFTRYAASWRCSRVLLNIVGLSSNLIDVLRGAPAMQKIVWWRGRHTCLPREPAGRCRSGSSCR